MANLNTVGDVLEALKDLPQNMPIRISIRDGRVGEFCSIDNIGESHLKEQNVDGDPEEYWNDPADLEEEDRLKPGDTHYAYKGRLILIS